MLFVELPLDSASERVGRVRGWGGELFIKMLGYFTVGGEGGAVKSDGLVRCYG